MLESIISENQCAFKGGRQNLDSMVILNEAMDEAKKENWDDFFSKLTLLKLMIQWNGRFST